MLGHPVQVGVNLSYSPVPTLDTVTLASTIPTAASTSGIPSTPFVQRQSVTGFPWRKSCKSLWQS